MHVNAHEQLLGVQKRMGLLPLIDDDHHRYNENANSVHMSQKGESCDGCLSKAVPLVSYLAWRPVLDVYVYMYVCTYACTISVNSETEPGARRI